MSLQNEIFTLRSAIIRAKREMKAEDDVEDHPIPPRERPIQESKLQKLRRALEKQKLQNAHKYDDIRYQVDLHELPAFSGSLKNKIAEWKKLRSGGC